MARVTKRGGVGKKGEEGFFPSPSPPPSFIFGSRSISRADKTENPVPRSFRIFAPKPNGNACYAGY